ncbi:hypothetical protein BDV96DRAFT_391020 [Lophiotrema nucula]|uniref:SPT2 chromatin protein-domain-containing protein n=1 Tax=Lophiotrema nucula TaxID=690887 RepID=A0A6A5ZJH4_9PLEO|nr:hypothetical protein BDV96DRAFT_391020 [Lophiotrema nucula]
MSLLNNLLSSIDPTATPSSAAANARQTQGPTLPRVPSRPSSTVNGTSQTQPLKRKADGQLPGGQIKIQRNDGLAQSDRMNSAARPAAAPDGAKPKPPTPTTSVPYRGTAGLGAKNATNPSNLLAKKPIPIGGAPIALPKSATSGPRLNTGNTPPPTSSTAPPKKGSYAAMLARAKQVQSTKPPTPPVKNEPTKILSKAERLALREQARAAGKGKKAGSVGPPVKAVPGAKGAPVQEKRKPAELGYQGTARPAKKPIETGYKGTARSATVASGSAGKPVGAGAAKTKPKPAASRYDGYADWSDLDEVDEEEKDYGSDASSDMEGGIWDVEQEEQLALKAGKQEDLEEMRLENELKRQKEERKKKLTALNKAAAAKRKY